MVSLKIAIAGTRGIPARYGGFETFAEELSGRLAKRGHEVWVYCRDTPHPPFGHLLPASGEKDIDSESPDSDAVSRHHDSQSPDSDFVGAHLSPQSMSLAPRSGERVAEGRVRGSDYPLAAVHRIVLPALRHKYFETVSHTFLSALDALKRDFDVVLLCNAANAFVLPMLRAARIPVAINVDGIERHRRKWNIAGKMVYAIGESFSALFATRVIADANVIADYYRQRYGIEPVTIPYGAEFPSEDDSDILERLGVESGNYILYVSRFEPENNPLEVVLAYEKLATPRKLIMLGAASYARDLEAELRRHASDRILFPGARYGRDYRTLQRNALIYIQATEVGGTHPAMIEAMASGGCVLAHDTPENREVGGDAVGYFRLRPSQTLSGTLSVFLESPAMREQMRTAARARAGERYGWTAVTDAYERLFAAMAR
jgi:glycosyltransferase involved in cell wall biosynthesis